MWRRRRRDENRCGGADEVEASRRVGRRPSADRYLCGGVRGAHGCSLLLTIAAAVRRHSLELFDELTGDGRRRRSLLLLLLLGIDGRSGRGSEQREALGRRKRGGRLFGSGGGGSGQLAAYADLDVVGAGGGGRTSELRQRVAC